jgi:ABC-type transporter Mla subunit MlaD
MTDRKLGYIIIGLFSLIITVLAAYCLRPILSPGETRIVAFKRIGSLGYQDPVRVRGVFYGTAGSINWVADSVRKEPRVYVTIQSARHIPLHRGYLIVDVDEGLMGDRAIVIDPGDSAAPLIPVRDTLVGTFYPGISEALDHVWELREVIDTFLSVSNRLAHGARGAKSLVVQVNEAVTAVDSLSKTILTVTRETQANLSTNVDSLNALVNSASLVTKPFAAAAPEYVDGVSGRLRDIAGFVASLDKTVDTLRSMSQALESPRNILWKSDAENIRKKIVGLQTIITTLQQRMLQFKIYIKL